MCCLLSHCSLCLHLPLVSRSLSSRYKEHRSLLRHFHSLLYLLFYPFAFIILSLQPLFLSSSPLLSLINLSSRLVSSSSNQLHSFASLIVQPSSDLSVSPIDGSDSIPFRSDQSLLFRLTVTDSSFVLPLSVALNIIHYDHHYGNPPPTLVHCLIASSPHQLETETLFLILSS